MSHGRLLRLVVIAVLAGAITDEASRAASPPASPPSPRARILLDAGWRFALHDPPDAGKDVTDYPEIKDLAKLKRPEVNQEAALAKQRPDPVATHAGEKVSTVAPGFDDGGWRKVDLPHDWAVELPFSATDDERHGFKALAGNSVGWYRRHFEVPAADAGKRLALEFDGIYRNALFWLNGHCLGRNVSGYIGAWFDVTPYLNVGGDNVLVVRVDATRKEGWFYEGAGIYRHVWLVKTDPLHVDHWGTFVTSLVSGPNATVSIETTVRNDGAASATGNLRSAIIDAKGRIVASSSRDLEVASGKTAVVTQTVELPDAQRWSPETPYLYKVVSTLKKQDATVDLYATPFGVRTVRFDPNGGFYLNDKRVELYGTANHQDHAGIGVALPDRVQYFRIETLKEMGSNAYRSAHNPPTPELLEACDKLGMLVIDETRRVGSDAETLSQLERMIRRDRNHPSIFIWSLGNEETALQGAPEGVPVMTAMQTVAHALDPSRKCTVAMNNDFGKGFSTVVDVQGFNYRKPRVDAFHVAFPKQPSFFTEETSPFATRGVYADDEKAVWIQDYDNRHAKWGSTTEEILQFVAARPWLGGFFAWTGFDYRGEPTPYKWPAIGSQFGLLDTCGFPKSGYYVFQAGSSEKPMLHLFPHWNWAGKENTPINVWAVGNCGDQVELFLNGKSQGKVALAPTKHAEWTVSYAPGTLEAKCTRDGKGTEKARVTTAGAPARLSLQPDRKTITADGRDVSLVTVAVVDAKGNVVPTANNKVAFAITGGTLLGLGNGDPGSHEADKALERSVFNGLAQAIVQSSAKTGSITLTATSPGLKPARVTVAARN